MEDRSDLTQQLSKVIAEQQCLDIMKSVRDAHAKKLAHLRRHIAAVDPEDVGRAL
jgi:hypothetical protein